MRMFSGRNDNLLMLNPEKVKSFHQSNLFETDLLLQHDSSDPELRLSPFHCRCGQSRTEPAWQPHVAENIHVC